MKVGDFTPYDPISKTEKYNLEKRAVDKISDLIPEPEMKKEMIDLWNEYEEGTTPEAILVKDIDRLEMIIQAVEYEKSK